LGGTPARTANRAPRYVRVRSGTAPGSRRVTLRGNADGIGEVAPLPRPDTLFMPADTPHAPVVASVASVAGIAIIGGGPAGLMAAEVLSAAGANVTLYDAMPTVGRKFLLAGKGGLNLTHSEPLESFLARYGSQRAQLEPMLRAFGPDELRAWAAGLGVATFTGSSGRVFPVGMQAAPLLRAWLVRLRAAGVRLSMRHRWLGFGPSANGLHTLRFLTPRGEVTVSCRAVLLALGGGSWARLGSNGAWVALLADCGADVAPLRPSNCGFDVARDAGPAEALRPGWSEHFRSRFAGHALKSVALSFAAPGSLPFHQAGECVITDTGVEGGLIYAVSASARDEIEARGSAVVHLDLLPGRDLQDVRDELSRPRGSRSLSNHLRTRLGLHGVKVALLHELLPRETFTDSARLAEAIKVLPLTLAAPRPLDEAISSAGGVRWESLTPELELRARPGVYCAGEMLDWEAPTGGYLLTACFASGVAAAHGILARLRER